MQRRRYRRCGRACARPRAIASACLYLHARLDWSFRVRPSVERPDPLPATQQNGADPDCSRGSGHVRHQRHEAGTLQSAGRSCAGPRHSDRSALRENSLPWALVIRCNVGTSFQSMSSTFRRGGAKTRRIRRPSAFALSLGGSWLHVQFLDLLRELRVKMEYPHRPEPNAPGRQPVSVAARPRGLVPGRRARTERRHHRPGRPVRRQTGSCLPRR